MIIKNEEEKWSLPKIDVRRGQSSVMALLRFVRETLEIQVLVLEEAGRITLSRGSNGNESEKLLFYLLQQQEREPRTPRDGKWLSCSVAKKRLALLREQKMLQQASDVLRVWRKKKKEQN